MSYDPISYLGLSCPSGGDFYICQDTKVQFLGCCDIDPCGSNGGRCPTSSVHPGSFDPDRYDEIPAQSCVSSDNNALWYTCTNSPTFLGCCTTNPCNEHAECPEDNLVGAALSSDSDDSEVFSSSPDSTSTTASASSRHTSTPSPTSTDAIGTPISSLTSSTTASQNSNQSPSQTTDPVPNKSSGTNIGAIVGGVVGGLVVLGLVLIALFLNRRRRERALVTTQFDHNVIETPPQPWSPYHDQFGSPPPVSPLSTPSTSQGFSATLGSVIGFKSPGKKRWSFLSSSGRDTIHSDWTRSPHDSSHVSQGFLTVSELDGSPRIGIPAPGAAHAGAFEVEGSMPTRPDVRPREMEG